MVDLLYFDFDHGVERQLFVRLDPDALLVDFRFEKNPDPTYDEESEDVEAVSVRASTNCPDPAQFSAFCRALVAAMRHTPFSLQDPAQPLFAELSHDALVLDGIGEGAPSDELTCRIPFEIAAEVFGPDRMERFKALVGNQE